MRFQSLVSESSDVIINRLNASSNWKGYAATVSYFNNKLIMYVSVCI